MQPTQARACQDIGRGPGASVSCGHSRRLLPQDKCPIPILQMKKLKPEIM